jgi:hypothetical protein
LYILRQELSGKKFNVLWFTGLPETKTKTGKKTYELDEMSQVLFIKEIPTTSNV